MAPEDQQLGEVSSETNAAVSITARIGATKKKQKELIIEHTPNSEALCLRATIASSCCGAV